MLHQRRVGEHQSPLHDLLERLGPVHLLVEAQEEPGELPADHGRDQLVAPAGKVAVDRGPRHIGLACCILHRRLGQTPAGHAVVRRLEQALPYLGVHSPSNASSPTVTPGRSATVRTARSTPGMNEHPVVGVVTDAQALSRRPEDDLFVGHQTGQAHRVHVHAPRALAPRAPGRTRSVVGSGGRGARPAARRPSSMARAVSNAVPDGASRLASWCSSITSTPSMSGAASLEKCMSSTAPTAKLAATMALGPPPRTAPSGRSGRRPRARWCR